MKKYLEHLLLSVLCATTILLALTFWLNTSFGFNLFSPSHWHELSVLQASGEPISNSFYVSIGMAILAFIVCLNIIYLPRHIKIKQPDTKPVENKPAPQTQKTQTLQDKKRPVEKTEKPEKTEETHPISQELEPHQKPSPLDVNDVLLTRPPALHLPKNIAQIAAAQYAQQHKPAESFDNDKFDQELNTIFSENAFLVKNNPTILGLKLNLFAIGVNEVVWIGGVNCDIEKLKSCIEKLESIFKETLEDIPITVNAFLLDTLKKYDSDSRVHIFHTIDEIRKYISENPGEEQPDMAEEDFSAYSDYIDTVLTLLYNT